MQVAMLGPLEVRTDPGNIVEVAGARLRALLIMLALQPGQLVTSSQLIDGLWPEEMPAAAANALQALVSRLRRALPEAVIESGPTGYRLRIDPAATDIARFEELAAGGRAELRRNPAAAAATLRQALALWRGPALAEVAEVAFGQAVIARLDELRLSTLEARIDADLGTGDTGSLVAELEGLVIAYPMREPLAARLMRALNAAGRRGAALEVYEQTRKRLAGQLGVEPSAGLAALHLAILRDEPTEEAAAADARPAAAPAAASSAREVSTNLRAELTSFVGRDADLRQVAALLGGSRLLTLTGPGGAGKTRLAVEAARAELTAAPDGVWLVELAPVTDPADVTSAVLTTLGLREQSLTNSGRPAASRHASGADDQGDPLGRLLGALARQRTLLVLDNCEHVVAAAAALADRILAACPQVRILTTSREPLNITGETLWAVGPLTLPPDPAATPAAAGRAALADSASVRLLTQRARAVVPGFEVTDENAAAVAAICRALDGMPLAIELAAARLRTMAPEQIAARLGDRFGLLTGGSRTAMPRHQTLRAVVDWSWDLLEEAERVLWRRFSVFAGGATLEAAEQVCAGSGLDASQILDLLSALADKSLLIVRRDPPRYRMLEIIRAYGQERLAETGERDQVRRAHAQYFAAWAEASQNHLLAAEQLDWLQRLADDQDNLHGAIRYAVAAGDAPTAVRLSAALGWYWFLRGMKLEGAELLGEALAVPGAADSVDPETLAVAYAIGALLTADTPLTGTGIDWLNRGAELAAQIPAPTHPMVPLIGPLASMFGMHGQPPGPIAPHTLDAAVANPHPWAGALARVFRAHATVNAGLDYARAKADFQAAASILAGQGERWGQAVALGGLAMLAGLEGEHAAAVGYYRQARDLVAAFGSTEDEVQFRLFMVRELWLSGEREAARLELSAALPDAEHLGLSELQAFAAYTAGDLARLDGRPEAAREALLRAMQLSVPPDSAQQIRALAATGLGFLASADGDLAAARGWHTQAVAAARFSADAPAIAGTMVGVADLVLREGEPERAAELLGACFAIRGTVDRSAPDEERAIAEAQSVLGAARYDEAYQRGQCAPSDTLAALSPLTPGA